MTREEQLSNQDGIARADLLRHFPLEQHILLGIDHLVLLKDLVLGNKVIFFLVRFMTEKLIANPELLLQFVLSLALSCKENQPITLKALQLRDLFKDLLPFLHDLLDVFTPLSLDLLKARLLLNKIECIDDIFKLFLSERILVKHQHVIKFDLAAVVGNHVFQANLSVFEVVTALKSVILEVAPPEQLLLVGFLSLLVFG